ncbi:MAG: hypothetical protein WCH83_08605 [Alphaproteobacteria bacterium]
MSPVSLQLFHSLALGFAVAGLLVAGFRLVADRPPSFSMLQQGGASALLAVPFLVFAAPAIIMRNTIRGRRIEKRRAEFVFAATLVALTWSLMSGRVLSMVVATFAF